MVATAIAVSAAGLACVAVAGAMRAPAGPTVTEDRHRSDTRKNRITMAALAVTGSAAVVALACASPRWAVQAPLAVVVLASVAVLLVVGGRIGYDFGARVLCIGSTEGEAHLVARGRQVVTHPDGTVICIDCAWVLAQGADR